MIPEQQQPAPEMAPFFSDPAPDWDAHERLKTRVCLNMMRSAEA